MGNLILNQALLEEVRPPHEPRFIVWKEVVGEFDPSQVRICQMARKGKYH